jgi:hypothetical protein
MRKREEKKEEEESDFFSFEKKYLKKMFLCLSGLSGVGKTTVGKRLAIEIPRMIFLDQDSYFVDKKPTVTLSNGESVSNYDCLEAIRWGKLNEDVKSLMKDGWNVLLVGFALWEEKLEIKPDFHFLLTDINVDKIDSQLLIKRCTEVRLLSKKLKNKERDQLMVKEVVVPFYLLTLQHLGKFIPIRTSYFDGEGKLVKYCIEDIISTMLEYLKV